MRRSSASASRPAARSALLATALLLIGCNRDGPPVAPTPGARLEAAAIRAGLVPDPERRSVVGSWSRGNDRVCVVPGASGAERVGVLLDYGEGNGCVGSGTVRRSGETLAIDLGACRVNARFDGERITFPAQLDPACDGLCRGNATLAALSIEQVSASAAEAATLRAPSGRLLCAD